MRLRTIGDVAAYQLCTGCGACAFVRPDRWRMVDDVRFGRRPVEAGTAAAATAAGSAPSPDEAFEACPGRGLEHKFDRRDPDLDASLLAAWGPVLDVWEGHAADPEIRRAGSSGGATTALSLYCIEKGGMHGVLHTVARSDAPYLNDTTLSRSRAELLAGTGSRYAPASPCEKLDLIAAAPGPCVFVGKPCDVAAVTSVRSKRPDLDRNLGLLVGFFCAGAPSTQGTLDLLARVGVPDPSRVRSLRYRGIGWPGAWTVEFVADDGTIQTRSLTYEESWGFLESYRQWRCYICPDHTGEFADVAFGDPWYRPVAPGEPGRSLIVARTALGRRTVLAAAAAGYLVLETRDATLLPRSQPNLLRGRGTLWGRLLSLGATGTPRPRYVGFPLFRYWLRDLSIRERLQSLVGTVRRVFRRGLRKRADVVPFDPPRGGQRPAPNPADA